MSDFSTAAIASPVTDPSTSGTTAVGNVYSFSFFTDYNNNGNQTNIYGQTIDYQEGTEGTQPKFFIPGQLIKIPHGSDATNADAGTVSAYSIWKVNSVDLDTLAESSSAGIAANKAVVNATCVKASGATDFFMNAVSGHSDTSADNPADAGLAYNAANTTVTKSTEYMEAFKCYVVGTAHAAGSGYPETW